MELKWFEDLICVAEKGHFARAATARNLTQSALSRRIKALESWVGADLLDRSTHPIELTPAGEEFISTASEIVSLAYHGKGRAAEYARLSSSGVTIACLHTLALYFVPKQITRLRRKIGSFEVSIVAETRTVEEYLGGLADGSTDVFICFSTPLAPLDIDEERFPKIWLGTERIAPYADSSMLDIDLSSSSGPEIPYLQFSGTSFISRVMENLIHKAPFAPRLKTVYRASLAESLCTGVQQGLGIAWLPSSIADNAEQNGNLKCISDDWTDTFDIYAYCASSNKRPIVRKIWETMQRQEQVLRSRQANIQ